MASMQLYHDAVRILCRKEISKERKRLLKEIDGDVFLTLKSWPRGMMLIFWKKPLGDWETIKLVLFLNRKQLQSWPNKAMDGFCAVLGLHHGDGRKPMPPSGFHPQQRRPGKKLLVLLEFDVSQWTAKSLDAASTLNSHPQENRRNAEKKTTKEKNLHRTSQGEIL